MATEWFASFSHLLAAPIALVWGLRAVRRHRGSAAAPAVALFALAAVVLLATSGVYHILPRGTAARELMLRLDHAAIWLMIASSFHAIHELVFEGGWRWIPPVLVWIFAVVGIGLIATVFDQFSTVGWLVMYIAAGWIGLVSLIKLIAMRRLDVVLLFVAGGLVYTVGAVADELFKFEPWLAFIGSHELWHIAVLGGIAFHAALIAYLASAPEVQRGSPAEQRVRAWLWALGQRAAPRTDEAPAASARATV